MGKVTPNFEFKSKIRVAISCKCNLNCAYCDNSHISDVDRIIAMEDFRSTPISSGCVSVQQYLQIFQSFYNNGFLKINFTGGEPMLNPQWDYIVKETKRIGFQSVEMTTNGTMIKRYLSTHQHFPKELDRVIISIDTFNPEDYKRIVGRDTDIADVLEGIQLLKERNPQTGLTANCVLCKSNSFIVSEYIKAVESAGFDRITFLDLVVRDPRDTEEIDYFKKQFLSGEEIKKILYSIYGKLEVNSGRHDYNVVLPSSLIVSVVDTKGPTRRDARCKECKQYCQEGIYTAKVATDGTIIDCLGENGIRINSTEAARTNTLDQEIKKIYIRLAESQLGYHFDNFIHSIGIDNI